MNISVSEISENINDTVGTFRHNDLCPDGDPAHPSSSWMVEGQRILLGASTEEMAKLSVTDIVVPFEVLHICTVLCCTVLYCAVLYCTALY